MKTEERKSGCFAMQLEPDVIDLMRIHVLAIGSECLGARHWQCD